MNQNVRDKEHRDLSEEIDGQKRIISKELKDRNLWFIKLRWFVPPGILLGAIIADRIGFRFAFVTLFLVAVIILLYNTLFYFKSRRDDENVCRQLKRVRSQIRWQFGLDFCVMFLLVHLTSGISSPLIFFFIFHIIFASVLLSTRSSYAFATLVVVGMAAITAAEYLGWIAHHGLEFHGKTFNAIERPAHQLVALTFFSASLYITVFFICSIMTTLRERISHLVDLSEAVKLLNQRLNILYTMIQAIGSIRQFDQVVKIVTSELGQVLEVAGISVKLLSEDGKFLHFAAADGLVANVFKDKVVEVSKSPMNRAVIEGKPFVSGCVTKGEMFQFGEDLAAASIQSVLFVPLVVEEKVIGILGAYCKYPERFTPEEVDFCRQVAGLVAVAIENAKSYEAIEKLIQERSWFMLRVAHNLRSPLAAVISILEVVRGGYQGQLNEDQSEYLRRADRRVRTMMSMINELLSLTHHRDQGCSVTYASMDLNMLSGRIKRTFQDEAEKKRLDFKLLISDTLPPIQGDADMIEQALENLVSNAIRYTPSGGRVLVEFSAENNDSVKIQISDTGIGIPQDAKKQIFTEFFRAENARNIEENGTGLGLAIVKEVVELHGGRIIFESEEGMGTLFVVHLPISNNSK